MGFYYRKSVKFGPFRLNFSKSGIGVSAGVRGARISTGPRGTYVHAGTNGFYYRQKIDGAGETFPDQYIPERTYEVSADAFRIHSADVSHFVDTSSAKLIEQINTASKQFRFAPLAGIATVVAAVLVAVVAASLTGFLLASKPITGAVALAVGLLILAIGSFLTWKIYGGDQLKRTTPLFYEMEEDVAKRFDAVNRANQTLSQSHRLWRVQTQQSTWDWKRNAGASSLITRSFAHVRREQPPYIATNVEVWSLRLNDQVLYYMPDYVFVRQNGVYGAISYESLRAEFAPTRFIEDQGVPSDSRILDYTWLYVNKKGGPDRRFSNNRQIPIAEYGFVNLVSASGLNLHLHISSTSAASFFAQVIDSTTHRSQGNYQRTSYTYQAEGKATAPPIDSKLKAALDTLGVSVSASSEQIIAAYRQMAKMYHPDRLSHLASEFVEIAEERMKEINVAYDYLKQQSRI